MENPPGTRGAASAGFGRRRGTQQAPVQERDELLLVQSHEPHKCIVSASAATIAIIQWLAASFRRELIPASPTHWILEPSAATIGSICARAEFWP